MGEAGASVVPTEREAGYSDAEIDLVNPLKDKDLAVASPAIGPVRRFGRYTLVKKLATGGMAEIWLARQRGLAGFNRFVVIKKILSHLSEQQTFVSMFLDEARMSAMLNHPNVVQIYDLGRESDAYYIAMEFIAGENLAAIAWRGMKRGKPFPPPFAARVIADGCKALYYAHNLKGENGKALEIVHRDISPQNILVTYEGEVKVVDFGIAKAATKSEQTKTGMLKGKFSYMSPEQCLGAPVDQRSDIFALGILLYELCTGKRLFKHESELMILEMITKRSVVPPSAVAPGISQRLEDIIMRALKKEKETRYQTAQEMQIALEEYLRDEGHQATNPDIAGYMRDLFHDKIEEKRLLREVASRDDFEAKFGDEEATEQAMQSRQPTGDGRRAVVYGASPSQLQVRGGTTPGSLAPNNGFAAHPATGSMPGGYPSTGSPGQTPGVYPMTGGQLVLPPGYAGGPISYNGQLIDPSLIHQDQGSGWVARVVIAGALIVILVASGILYQQLNQQPETVPEQQVITTAPVVPRKTGSLTLESVPQGATIFLDEKTMPLASGAPATTPSDLHSLQFGTTYKIRLQKTGYKPFETEVVMGENTNSTTVRPELEAFPGTLIVEVLGDDRANTRVLLNSEDAGLGPRIKREIPGNQMVRVDGQLDGKICEANPPRVRIMPSQTKNVEITCRDRGRSARAAASPPPVRTVAPPPAAIRPRPAGDCGPTPGLPEGFVTISTRPYADLFIDGKKIGDTPLNKHKLPSGCVRISAKSKDGKHEREVKIEVEPNRIRIYKFNLDE